MRTVIKQLDIIDVRDIIHRFEELDEELQQNYTLPADNRNEFKALQSILKDLKGNGGDERWRGDWYPLVLIRESYFTDYVKEMLEDCGTIPKDLPFWIAIDWEKTADNVRVDYSATEIDGTTYWYR